MQFRLRTLLIVLLAIAFGCARPIYDGVPKVRTKSLEEQKTDDPKESPSPSAE